MKKLFPLLIAFFVGQVLWGQGNPNAYNTTILDTNFDISAWGTEPGWKLDFTGTTATGHLPTGTDELTTFRLLDRVGNQGFTNEYVDTYRFVSSSGETITLMLVNGGDCPCGYDMGEGESAISAYLQLQVENKASMLLGCATIRDRP